MCGIMRFVHMGQELESLICGGGGALASLRGSSFPQGWGRVGKGEGGTKGLIFLRKSHEELVL